MSEILIVCSIIWIIGFTYCIAVRNKSINNKKEVVPKWILITSTIVLFIAWPYFYFYWKA